MVVYYYRIPEKQNTFFLAGVCICTKLPAVVEREEMNGGLGWWQELGCWQGSAGFEGKRWLGRVRVWNFGAQPVSTFGFRRDEDIYIFMGHLCLTQTVATRRNAKR
jgi:hypothetical protein